MADVYQKLVNVVVKVVGNADKAVRKVTTEMQNFDKRVGAGAKTAGLFAAASKRMDQAVKQTTNRTKQANQQFKSMDATLGQITGSIARTAAVIGSIAFPVVKAAQFQRSMSEVQALFGATGRELEALTATARKMGATTEFSALEAASGLRYLAMAGLSTTQAMEALPNVLNLAQAGALDLGRAADIATNIMTGFGFGVEDLTRVNDVMVQTFTNTNSTLEELGEAMSYVGPVAAGLGADFEDVSAALGLLHSAGIKGSMAGTSLRGAMVRLVSPTKDAAKGIANISERLGGAGLQLKDSEGNWIGFTGLIRQLEQAGATTTEVIDILGQRAGPGLAALLSQGSRALERMTLLNKQAEGRAARVAAVMHENVVGSLKAFQSAAIDAAIEIGNKLLPALDKVLKFAADLFVKLGDLAKAFPKVTATVTVLTAAVVGLFGAMMTASTISLILTGSAIKWRVALTALGGKITAVTGAIFSMTGAMVALVAAAAAITFSKTVRTWVSDFEIFGFQVKEIVVGAVASIIYGFEGLLQKVHGIFVDLGKIPAKAFGNILSIVGQWGGQLVDTIGKIPGLGKLLGWDDEGNKVRGVFDDLTRAGQEMVANAQAEAAASKKAFTERHSLGEQVLDQITQEYDARSKMQQIEENYQAIRAKEVALEKDIAKAASDIIGSRKAGLEELEKAAKLAEKKWSQQNEALTGLISSGDQALSDLAKSIDKNITKVWEGVTADTAVEGYRQSLAKLTMETEAFGTNNAVVMAQASGKLADAQVEAITSGLSKIEGMYDAQVETYKIFQEAQVNTTGESAARRAQIERDTARKVEKFSLEVLEKKKGFYEKATTALKAELERSREAEAETAKKIIDINEQIRQSKLSAEEKIRELRRKTMTEEEVYADKVKQYQEYLAKAQENVGSNYKLAAEFAKKAQDAATDLTKTSKDGQTDVTAAIEGVTAAQQVMEQAALAEKRVLEESAAKHKENTSSLEASFATITEKLKEAKSVLGEGLKAAIEVDRTDFDKQIEAIKEQKEVVVNARINLDEAQRQVGEWIARTAELGEQATLKIQTSGEAELQEMLTTLTGVQDKLKEEVTFKVNEKGLAALDDTEKHLLKLSGLKTELNESTGEIKVVMSEDSAGTEQRLIDLNEKTRKLGEPITVAMVERLELEQTFKLMDDLKKLPSIEAPQQLKFTADSTEVQTDLATLTEKIETVPIEKEVKVTGPTLATTKQDAVGLTEAIAKIKENVVVNATVKGVSDAVASIRALADAIVNLPKLTEVTVVKKVITKYSTEGSPPAETKAQTGMRISGYGGGDRVPALLEPGEWVIRKEAVRKYGDTFLARLNAGILPRFRTGGKVLERMFDGLAGSLQKFGVGGKVLKYQDFSKIVEQLNYLGDDLEMVFHQGRDPRFKREMYHPEGRAIPDVAQLWKLLDMLDQTPLSGVSTRWKQGIREKIAEQVKLYEEAGARTGYINARNAFYDAVRRSSPRGFTLSDEEIEYGFTLRQSFGDQETSVTPPKIVEGKGDKWDLGGKYSSVKRLAEMFATLADRPDQQSVTQSEVDETRMKGGVEIVKYAMGGPVKELSSVPRMVTGQLASLFKKFQTGGNVPSTATIKHQVDFTLGNRSFGPFEGSGATINDFIAELQLAKGRV